MAYHVWRLRRRAAGRCTGPYAGAAVGAMCGPCRRRVLVDAAVARVVVCTGARPLVRIWTRGGGMCMMFLMLGQSTLLFAGRQSCGVWLFHGLGSAATGLVWLKCRVAIAGCNSLVRTMAYRWIVRSGRNRCGCNSCSAPCGTLMRGGRFGLAVRFIRRQSCGTWLCHSLGSAVAVMMGFGATHFSRQVAIHVSPFGALVRGGVCA